MRGGSGFSRCFYTILLYIPAVSFSDSQKAEELISHVVKECGPLGPILSYSASIAAHALCYLYNDPVNPDVVISVLYQLEKRGEASVDVFEEEMETLQRGDPDKSWRKFAFYMPIQVEIDDNISTPWSLKLWGEEFRFMRSEEVAEEIDVEELDATTVVRIAKDPKVSRVTPSYLSVAAYGTSRMHAWEQVEYAFDTLMGFIEYKVNRQVRIGGDDPRSLFPHPRWRISIDSQGEKSGTRFLIPDREVKSPIVLNKNLAEELQDTSATVRDSHGDGEVESLFATAVQLYAQAMWERGRTKCVLGLWQVLECIALPILSSGGNTRTVAKRTARVLTDHLPASFSGLQEALMQFGDLRNEIVHSGVIRAQDETINVLKITCQLMIQWLEEVKHDLPTRNHIEHFYKFLSNSEAELVAVQETARLILFQRD